MGGSILFNQNGTFKPSAYGLTTGKRINYIAIGGGGAGGAGYWAYNTSRMQNDVPYVSGGTYGTATSIGSYVTAPGAKPTTEKHLAKMKTYTSDGDGDYTPRPTYVYGGCGETGWTPGIVFRGYTSPGRPSSETKNSEVSVLGSHSIHSAKVSGGTLYSIDAIESASVAVAMTVLPDSAGGMLFSNHMKTESDGSRTYTYSDGVGYGGGGGGVSQFKENTSTYIVAGPGGYAGTYKEGSFELTSTNNIPITIGQGGTPHTTTTASYNSNYDKYYYNGYPGISGAVMLWWD